MRNQSWSPMDLKAKSFGQKVAALSVVGLVGAVSFAVPVGAANSTVAHHSTHGVVANHAAKKAVKKVVTKAAKVAFKGTYSGTIGLLWSSSGVQATSVKGSGAGTYGANVLSGTGGGSASSTCDPFSGSGVISGASGLKLKIVSSTKTQACATGSAAPTTVNVKGVATVLSGTGKFARATGTLSFHGSFSIQATTAGSSESDTFTATFTGPLTIK